jgi:hypothetical protein
MGRDDLDQNPERSGGGPACALCAALILLAGCSATPLEFLNGGEMLMIQYRTPSHEVDYRAVGLSQPPMGLRWYHVDRNYVLANRTTGLIIKTVPIPQTPPATVADGTGGGR